MCIFTASAMLGGAAAASSATAAATAAAASAALMANIGLAMSAATTAMTFYGQSKQVAAQNAMMAYRQRVGKANALAAFHQQTKQARNRQLQEREAAANEINSVYQESRRRLATAQVSAGEGGVTGPAVMHLMRDFQDKDLAFATNVNRNLQFREDNIEDNLEAVRLGTKSRIENLQYIPHQKPSFIGAALRIGAAGFNQYAQGRSITGWNAAVAGNPTGYGPGGMGPPEPGYGSTYDFGNTTWSPYI